ncbi:MAG: squalene/phytoene synthase family protein [Hyphomicrobiales bacterium]|nr:squalene/phytoene synthase family protein [Hyphomicrobiales bacterium]MCP5374408.1 squalene/phytoene synthase family protein [Hyphomicrobiales bacterium]
MADVSYCLQQARRHDRDRLLCALFAAPGPRDALVALLAFNLEAARVRETVSEPLIGLMRLQWWRDALDPIFAGTPPHHQVAMPLSAAVRAHGLSRRHFERLLDARRFDLEDEPPATLADLESYAEATSGGLTLLALEALGARGDAAREAGRRVGIAWALAGLMRAVPYHARLGKSFLPADRAAAAGLPPGVLFDDRHRDRHRDGIAAVVQAVAGAAAGHLRAARDLRPGVEAAARPALLPAALADGHLADLRRARFDPFARPPRPTGPGRMAGLVLRNLRRAY